MGDPLRDRPGESATFPGLPAVVVLLLFSINRRRYHDTLVQRHAIGGSLFSGNVAANLIRKRKYSLRRSPATFCASRKPLSKSKSSALSQGGPFLLVPASLASNDSRSSRSPFNRFLSAHDRPDGEASISLISACRLFTASVSRSLSTSGSPVRKTRIVTVLPAQTTSSEFSFSLFFLVTLIAG